MLHIVQVVMWGVAERPQIFTDEAKAQAAFAQLAKKHWEKRYAAYCEHHGLNAEAFASAEAFVKALDVSEKSDIHLWHWSPEEAGLGASETASESKELRQLAKEIVGIEDGLSRLLEEVSQMAGRFKQEDAAGDRLAAGSAADAAPFSASKVPAKKPAPESERYASPEWPSFISTIMRALSGSSNEFYMLSREAWRQAVYSDGTSFEYWEWVADSVMDLKETAEKAGYGVAEEPSTPGSYSFIGADGAASERSFESEWEAWCAAGLTAAGEEVPVRGLTQNRAFTVPSTPWG